MALSKKELIRASNHTTYSRGEAYFRQGRVKVISAQGSEVEAEVRGSTPGEPYQVTLAFTEDGNELEYGECDCPAYEQYEGICKHIVAAVLKAQSLREAGGDLSVKRRSDNAAMQMMNAYIQSIANKAGESHVGHVRLEAVLEYDALQSASIFLRVGEERMYIVPDLSAFHLNFGQHATTSYGKFTLWHGMASFAEESRPLVEFFLKRYDAYNYIHNSKDRYRYYGYGGKKRNMHLSPGMADELFGLLEGKRIATRDAKRREGSALVKREDFRPRLRLKQVKDGAELDIVDWYILLEGDRGIHVFNGSVVYMCGEEFARACGELLKVLAGSGRKLFFARKDIGVLFSTVLPQVEPFVRLQAEGEFEEFKPLPLEAKIYLDCPGADSVSAHMTFSYGERSHDAFGEKDLAASQDLAGEILAENLLAGYFGNVVYEGGTLRIDDDPDAVYRLVTEGLEALGKIAELYTTDAFGKIRLRPAASVTVGVRVDAGLLRLDFDLDGLDLSELPAIMASYRLAKKYHRLRDGSLLSLEESALGGLSELAEGLDLTDRQLASGHAELAASRAMYLDAICKQSEELRVDRDRAFKKILRDMREVENADFTVPAGLRKVLRNYQKTGFRWLKTIAAYGFGGILADDMGLGKTVQILALLKSYRDEECEKLPSLVVCPSSLSLNWESEARKFTPDLRCAVIGGAAPERAAQIAGHGEYDLLITSYDLLKRDIEQYAGIRFAFVIIDEAQYIKNQGTQNAKAVKALDARVRFALTGTPVENSLAELWSIFDFLMPGYLMPYNRFRKNYEEPIAKEGSKEASERLKQLVRPFLLRRLKKDVLRELPAKTETVLRSSMGDAQKQVYVAHLLRVKEELAEQSGLGAGQERIAILAALTRMRQVCCDPALVYENYSGGSSKLEACMELVDSCIAAGRRLLLFSQFTSMLDILEGRLTQKELAFLRIDGATKPSRRLELVNAFNAGNIPVFLISLKAGGTGLNLTGADVVIHYDPWWNLSAQNQATDRAHRIGQKNRVQVYKLIVKDTIEERILEMQERKSQLASAVLEDGGNPLDKLNREDLLALLEA